MENVQESRERQRLFVPSRATIRPAGAPEPAQGGPQDPWAADYPWRPAGQEPDYARDAGHPFLVRLGIVALIGMSNLALLSSSLLLENLVVLLDVLGVVLVLDLLLELWRAFRRLRPRMRWKTFPAYLGGRLEAELVARPFLEPIGPALAILRCVHDERIAGAHSSESSLEPTVIYQQRCEVPVPELRLKELPLAFDIPVGLPGTDLGRDDAIYWQIALRIPSIGPDFETVFLAPVYGR